MIQINATTNTKSGMTIGTSSILNVTPHFMDHIDSNGLTKYDVSFDVDIYKDMNEYLSNNILIKSEIQEYNVGYTEHNIDIQALTSVSDLITLLSTHIENGDGYYPGVGVSNTSIVYPPVV